MPVVSAKTIPHLKLTYSQLLSTAFKACGLDGWMLGFWDPWRTARQRCWINSGAIMLTRISIVKVPPGVEKAAYHVIKEIDGASEAYPLFRELDPPLIMRAGDRSALDRPKEKTSDLKKIVEL
jgi:hypothetical protein